MNHSNALKRLKDYAINLFSILSLSLVSIATVHAQVEKYDVFEMAIPQKKDAIKNPFTDALLQLSVTQPNGKKITVDGFCDAEDGTLFKARFMPVMAGNHRYEAVLRSGSRVQIKKGTFSVSEGFNKGPVRVDLDHPWHMLYEGSGQHYFWNSTTCYWLLGWKDEGIIKRAIDRFASYGINRIRVAINGRQDDGKRWSEPLVKESNQFTFLLNPWKAARPDDLDNPGFDVTHFNVAHWQKLDRVIAYAREKGIVVSLIFYVDGLEHGTDPFKKNMGGDDEKRYYAYAAARYSAYENIMWDITNEYHLFRTVNWVNEMGPFLKAKDVNNHILSIHGSSDFPFRKAPFVDVVLYQSWDECGGYQFITNARDQQKASGRIMPQINEEYGYEDHYPPWGCGPTATKQPSFRSAVYRSQLAWEMCMAGGYQTTGERANEGTGAGNDSGGGWINGRGNDKMVMLNYYRIMKNCFEKTAYWKMEPANHLVPYGNLCLANGADEIMAYFRTHYARISLPQHAQYTVRMIDPETGAEEFIDDYKVANNAWHHPKVVSKPLVVILKRKQ